MACYGKYRRKVFISISFSALCHNIEAGGNGSLPSLPNLLARSKASLSSRHDIGKCTQEQMIKMVASVRNRERPSVSYYYGMSDELLFGSKKSKQEKDEIQQPENTRSQPSPIRPTKPSSLSEVMDDTLIELRELREDIAVLQEELRLMKRRMNSPVGSQDGIDADGDREVESYQDDESDARRETQLHSSFLEKSRRQREFDKIGLEVERWAEQLLFNEHGEEHGWKEVFCNNLFKKTLNSNDRTQCFVKWMKDPRGIHSKKDDEEKEYPCLKCFATLDAPIEEVCAYLADEKRLKEYNDFVVKYRDLEDITPHSKICWGQCPQILFIKPRDFVTFCHHRWLRDGSQVVVNQACSHPSSPDNENQSESKALRAYALRGANYIEKHPEDPQKTRFSVLIHADPGGVPDWACKTAVNTLAPIEPFKLFHNINEGVKRAREENKSSGAQNVSSLSGGRRSTKPGGLSQLGYACFWPNGGGLKGGHLGRIHTPLPRQEELLPEEELSERLLLQREQPALTIETPASTDPSV